jgi:1-acyl-sn-glycerol-3-phosphate acyltransferase
MTSCSGIKVVRQDTDFDYTPYLGPNYRKNHSAVKQASTLVSNHQSFYDNFVICRLFPANFIAQSAFLAIPLLGLMYAAVGAIFVDITSDGTHAEREKVV